MGGRNWARAKEREWVRLANRQRIDEERYTADLKQADTQYPPPPAVSKAKQRAAIAHLGLPLPWGPWTEWKMVLRPDGSVYWERSASRLTEPTPPVPTVTKQLPLPCSENADAPPPS